MAEEKHNTTPGHITTQRDLDPNVRQRTASNPEASVWVNASAGTGKTKVLTDRVLRLLMPRPDGAPGTAPHKILCLTFTKAGASEMALRINKTLSKWAVMEDEALIKALNKTLARDITPNDIRAARQLFAAVIDTAGGLKILTIHAFCQSVLSRFPLEAGLPPAFKVLEASQASALLESARTTVLTRPQNNDDTYDLNAAIKHIAATINEQQFSGLIRYIISERAQMRRTLTDHQTPEGLYTKLCLTLNVEPGKSAEVICQDATQTRAFNHSALKEAAAILIEEGNKTDQKHGTILAQWLSASPETRTDTFNTYLSIYFRADMEPRAKLAGAKIPDHVKKALAEEASRLEYVLESMKAAQCAALTRDVITLGESILNRYEALKTQKAVLDFDDLIYKTQDLLHQKGGAAWVMYKLDQGLDHILVDEAQDTNPEQWNIVSALSDEFFRDHSEANNTRTVFAVGDQKQSIYSFQRASPQSFIQMKEAFSTKITATEQTWAPVDLNISFRSTPSVLSSVDAVFASQTMRQGLSDEPVEHVSFRKRQEGRVEVWPAFEPEDTENFDPWTPPTEISASKSGAAQLAEHIAKTVAGWISDQTTLPSHGRPIDAGDIMILVRTRTAFVNQMIRAFKTHDVPVSGVDRMVLSDQLVVEDLMAIIRFALLPQDDLTLACVLKSPLIGLDEDALYNLSTQRKGTLWAALQGSEHSDIYNYLKTLTHKAQIMRPFGFISDVLYKACPERDGQSGLKAIKSRLGDDCIDAIEELLNSTLTYEKNEIPSLQHFLAWHEQSDAQIKRELSAHTGEVRIMTVHGSKGLQAPIVILPDTIHGANRAPGQHSQRFLWPDKTGLDVPIWSPRKDTDTKSFKEARTHINAQDDEEYKRLLYVAMTRAEDRLYIAGHTHRKTIPDECWYNMTYNALSQMQECERLECGTLRLTNPQIGEPDRVADKADDQSATTSPPAWLFNPAPSEPNLPRPFRPSRPSGDSQEVLFKTPGSKTVFVRGNATHKLLELLPDVEPEKRRKAGAHYLSKLGESIGTDFSKDVQDSILEETLALLEDKKFAPLFGPGSQSEVPITGLINENTLISGQIDRLLIKDNEIWILDYKTSIKIPKTADKIPKSYKNQLKSYANTLQMIYPAHKIHCALLWTRSAKLMSVDIDKT